MTITLIAVVVLFLVCQVPLAVQTQLSIYATEPTAMRLSKETMTLSCFSLGLTGLSLCFLPFQSSTIF